MVVREVRWSYLAEWDRRYPPRPQALPSSILQQLDSSVLACANSSKPPSSTVRNTSSTRIAATTATRSGTAGTRVCRNHPAILQTHQWLFYPGRRFRVKFWHQYYHRWVWTEVWTSVRVTPGAVYARADSDQPVQYKTYLPGAPMLLSSLRRLRHLTLYCQLRAGLIDFKNSLPRELRWSIWPPYQGLPSPSSPARQAAAKRGSLGSGPAANRDA